MSTTDDSPTDRDSSIDTGPEQDGNANESSDAPTDGMPDYEDRPVLRFRELTSFQQAILRKIAKLGDPHGLAIKAELEEYYEREIHHGRLYPNIDTLVEKGFVEKGERDKRTNYHVLTAVGERVVANEVERDYETVCGEP